MEGSLAGVSERLAIYAGMQGAAEPDRNWVLLRSSF